MDRAVARIADQQIRDAMENGAFDHLEGAGKPIPDLDAPVDDMWWLRRWLKRQEGRVGSVKELSEAVREVQQARRRASAEIPNDT